MKFKNFLNKILMVVFLEIQMNSCMFYTQINQKFKNIICLLMIYWIYILLVREYVNLLEILLKKVLAKQAAKQTAKQAVKSTGRTIAKNLTEQLAMEQVKSSPTKGRILKSVIINDAKNGWYAKDGWVKMAQNVNGVEIHYLWNTITQIAVDFKFK